MKITMEIKINKALSWAFLNHLREMEIGSDREGKVFYKALLDKFASLASDEKMRGNLRDELAYFLATSRGRFESSENGVLGDWVDGDE